MRLRLRRGLAAVGLWLRRDRWSLVRRRSVDAAAPVEVHFGGVAPPPGVDAQGGNVKLQRLQEVFPDSPRRFSILYLGSGCLPPDLPVLLRLARRSGAKLVLNQNGVAYPAVYPGIWRQINAPMSRALHAADHVIYQSEFCRRSADAFLGRRDGPAEVLYNSVDIERFAPAAGPRPARPLTLLLAGTQQAAYRLESALRATAAVARECDVRLIVAGRLAWGRDEASNRRWAEALVAELRLGTSVSFVGRYRQAEAPSLYRQADLLVHTQVNDASPGLVVEALACALPVVFSESGGVPELVEEAGVGVPARATWAEIVPPDPDDIAAAVLAVAGRLDDFAEVARLRAVERFDLRDWLRRHRELFAELLR